LLTRIKNLSPDTVRILLTGQPDLETAIAAVNEGSIFRFLRKPCPQALLMKTIDAGLAQYQLQVAERDVLQETLVGTVAVLVDLLSVVQPAAFGRASRLRWSIRKLALELRLHDAWQFEAAAMLSQIGTLVTPEVMQSYFGSDLEDGDTGRERLDAKVAYRLLERIPRLRTVAQMIDRQHQAPQDLEGLSAEDDPVSIGAQMLRVALEFDRLVASKRSFGAALAGMQQNRADYHPDVLAALEKVVRNAEGANSKTDVAGASGGAAMDQYLLQPIAQQVLRAMRS
jgi:response regulator RpfG family c-di-GMP phosphodiesterase